MREIIKNCLEREFEIEDILLTAKTAKNWTEFKTEILFALEGEENE